MTLLRRFALAGCLLFLLAAVAPRIGSGPNVSGPPPRLPQAAPASQPLAYTLPPDKLAKAIALDRIQNVLAFAGSWWEIAVLWLLLATRTAARLERWTKRAAQPPWLQGLLFFAVLLVVVSLANLPLESYAHHVGRTFGISVQGWLSWLGDQAKALALTLAVGAPVLLLFNWIVRRWPRRYWLGAWVATLPLMALSVFLSPLLEPVFNQYEPLARSHPQLVAKLETVVQRTGTHIPRDRMYLMKASLKTNGLNAYVSGLGVTKRIVVWDTTAGRIPDDQVLFIFAHESGHYVLHHISIGLAASAVSLFFVYWACAGCAAWMARRFRGPWALDESNSQAPLASRAGFVTLLLTLSLAGMVLEPVGNAFSRHIEHQADVYGQEAIHGLVPDPQKTAVAAFNSLGEAWLENPYPNPFIEFWTYNHPSIQNRARFAARYNPWANGGEGSFFRKDGEARD